MVARGEGDEDAFIAIAGVERGVGAAVYGSRLVLVHYPDARGAPRILGLLAEQVTDTLQCKPEEFQPSTLVHSAAPYLRDVITYHDRLVQRVEIPALLPSAVQALLFQ